MGRVLDTEENESKCICPSCPSYPRNGDAVLYCSRGKSTRSVHRVRCTCPGCPIWHENNLSDLYYCDTDPALLSDR